MKFNFEGIWSGKILIYSFKNCGQELTFKLDFVLDMNSWSFAHNFDIWLTQNFNCGNTAFNIDDRATVGYLTELRLDVLKVDYILVDDSVFSNSTHDWLDT